MFITASHVSQARLCILSLVHKKTGGGNRRRGRSLNQCPVMRFISSLWVFFGIAASYAEAVDVVHFPPDQTEINNLTFILNTNEPFGIFNSSHTPDDIYGIYNWCNMPHVRTREYKYVCPCRNM